MSRQIISDDEVDKARNTLRNHYLQWVDAIVQDLVRSYFTETDGGIENIRDDMIQVIDNNLTYTKDQYEAIYASESSGDGLDEARDAGVFQDRENNDPVATWAFFTLQYDVEMSLSNNELVVECERAGANDLEEKAAWLAETHGKLFLRKSGLFAYYIGVLNEGQRDEIDFGILTSTKQAGDRGAKYDFISIARARKDERFAVALDALEEGNQEKFIDDEVEDPED